MDGKILSNYYDYCSFVGFFSGSGYVLSGLVTNLTGDWRWGLRVTPILVFISVIFMIIFLGEVERGEHFIFIL